MKEYSYQERHMGTVVSLSFICPDQVNSDIMAHYAFSVIKEWEQKFSRFLPDSELSSINQNGSGFISSEFKFIFLKSLQLAELTHNNFNPLAQVRTLGYVDTYPFITTTPHHTNFNDLHYSTDLNLCSLDVSTSHLTLGPNQELDFGGLLKGYLAAKLADELMASYPTCTGCIINIGGDLATRGFDEFHKPFIFYLYNPVTGTELPVKITDKSLATSGTYNRHWQTISGTCNHIVDTKTKQNPTTDLVSVSIIAEDGALTEAITKLFLARGTQVATTIVPPSIYHYQYLTVSNDGEIDKTIT